MESLDTHPGSLSGTRISFRIALVTLFILWLGYTALQTLLVVEKVSPGWYAILGFLPGVLGLAVLLWSGFSRERCYLRFAPLSKIGARVLALSVLAELPILLSGQWRGWTPFEALVGAPASGIAQELFFRVCLLPALLVVFKGRVWPSLLAHSALFGLWHIGPAFMGAPLWGVLAVMTVPFLVGLLWGWQVQRDRTVLWMIILHSLLLVSMSFFTWG